MDRVEFSEWLKRHSAQLHERMTTTAEGYLRITTDHTTGQQTIELDERAPHFSRWPKELVVHYSFN